VHCTSLHCTALHCTALHCTALHCTALPLSTFDSPCSELESQIESLRETQRKYSNILRLSRALTSHFYHVVQTQVPAAAARALDHNRIPASSFLLISSKIFFCWLRAMDQIGVILRLTPGVQRHLCQSCSHLSHLFPHFIILQCSAVQCSAVQCSAVQ
jgi:hypothetical protein